MNPGYDDVTSVIPAALVTSLPTRWLKCWLKSGIKFLPFIRCYPYPSSLLSRQDLGSRATVQHSCQNRQSRKQLHRVGPRGLREAHPDHPEVDQRRPAARGASRPPRSGGVYPNTLTNMYETMSMSMCAHACAYMQSCMLACTNMHSGMRPYMYNSHA